MARTLPTWHEPEVLLELASLAVAEREDAGREDVLRALAPLRTNVGGDVPERRPGDVEFLKMSMVEISSSMVRELVAAGEPVRELVGPAVATYIAEHGLYRAGVAAEAKAGVK
jgi:nicotinate-nucleotide adenylyltransferase